MQMNQISANFDAGFKKNGSKIRPHI